MDELEDEGSSRPAKKLASVRCQCAINIVGAFRSASLIYLPCPFDFFLGQRNHGIMASPISPSHRQVRRCVMREEPMAVCMWIMAPVVVV